MRYILDRHFRSIQSLHQALHRSLLTGPVAVIIAEDEVELDSTLRHHLALGFGAILLFCPARTELPAALGAKITRVDHDTGGAGATEEIVNALIGALPDQWLYYCYNAEYLFFPFCETRTVAELLDFHAGERREAMRAMVLDLYAGDEAAHEDGTAIEDAWFDGSAYFGLNHRDEHGAWLERQDEIYGGLRWRFEQEIPVHRQRLDRVPIFRARPGLTLLNDHRLSDPDMNTISSPWHHSATAVIASFRCAKALSTNSTRRKIALNFRFSGSVAFDWTSQQLMARGFMEPGQWF